MAERWRAAAMVAVLLPAPAAAQTAEAMMARGRALTAARPCRNDAADAITVCGRADAGTHYRLPLPDERPAAARPSSGGLPMAELLKAPGACSPSGPRRCTKREALTQGLGGGRDPVTLAARLVGRPADPDGD